MIHYYKVKEIVKFILATNPLYDILNVILSVTRNIIFYTEFKTCVYYEEGEFMDSKVKIADTESIVLQILWQSEDAMSINDINAQLKKEGITWAYTTVATIMRRMDKKQLVSYEKIDRTFYYRPLVKPTKVVNGARKYINRYFGGSLARLLASFEKDEQITAEDIEAIKEWLKRMESKG